MSDRGPQMLLLGLIGGGLAAFFLMGGSAATWGWRAGAVASGHDVIVLPIRPAQGAPVNPQEMIPIPNPQNGQGPGPGVPSPGMGGQQDCDKILFFYKGRLYLLRPGPMPRNGGNPEFYYMQPYEGPQLPGFPAPGPMGPDMPGPTVPDQTGPPRHI